MKKVLAICSFLMLCAFLVNWTFASTSQHIREGIVSINAEELSKQIYLGNSSYNDSTVFKIRGEVVSCKSIFQDTFLVFSCKDYPNIYVQIFEGASVEHINREYLVKCRYIKNIEEISFFKAIKEE